MELLSLLYPHSLSLAVSMKRRDKRHYPADSLKTPRFTGPFTFARLPHVREPEGLDAAFIGAPFDGGVVFRSGARFGPSAVRQGSLLLRLYNPALGVKPFDILEIADMGDITVVPSSLERTYENISDAIRKLLQARVTPVVCGGDHSITLPILREIKSVHGKIALIHFDSHLDTVDSHFSLRYTHGTVFRRALEEGLIEGDRSVHAGIRGGLFSEDEIKRAEEEGFTVISMDDIDRIGAHKVAASIAKRVGDYPCYVSFDIDACDPAYAPGTGTPEVGGLTSREALLLVRGLTGLRLVGFDLVEVSPQYDHGEITAILAANLIYEFMSLLALSKIKRG
jgi:agmatinase